MDKIKYEILWNDLIISKYLKKVKIDIDQIKRDLKDKSKEKEYFWSEIVFNLNNNEDLNDKLTVINETIKNNSFSEAALIYSISASSEKGGKIGWVKENSLSNKIREQLYLIKKQEITNPIVIPGGFLLLKMDDYRIVEIEVNSDVEIKKITQKNSRTTRAIFNNLFK